MHTVTAVYVFVVAHIIPTVLCPNVSVSAFECRKCPVSEHRVCNYNSNHCHHYSWCEGGVQNSLQNTQISDFIDLINLCQVSNSSSRGLQ